MKKKYYVFVITLLLYNCASKIYSLPENKLKQITTRLYKYDYKTVLSACIEAFEKEGFIVEDIDSEFGLIKTDWKIVDDPWALQKNYYRYRASARIKQIEPQKIKVILTIPSIEAPPRLFEREWIGIPISKDEIKHFEFFFKAVEKILKQKR